MSPGPSTDHGPSLLPPPLADTSWPPSPADHSPRFALLRARARELGEMAWEWAERTAVEGCYRLTTALGNATTTQTRAAMLILLVLVPAVVTVLFAIYAGGALQKFPAGIPAGTGPARLVAAAVAFGGFCALYAGMLGILWVRAMALVHEQRQDLSRLERTVRRQGEDLKDSREQTELLTAMREVSHIVAGGHDFDAVLADVLRIVENYARPTDVTIFLDDGDGQLMPRASLSPDTADAVCAIDGAMEAARRRQVVRQLDVRGQSMSLFIPFDAEANTPGVLRIVRDLDAESVGALAGETTGGASSDSWPAIGAQADAEPMPAVDAESIRRELGAFERRLVSFVKHVTLAVRHLTLYDRATIDGLTRLFNRPMFDRQLATHTADAAHTGQPLAVVMIDIDKFKLVNDVHGHLSGDLILAGVARLIRTTIPDGALAFRFGGEEMSVICPGSDATDAAHIAENLRAAVEAADLRGEHGQRIPTTISLGIAEFQSGESETEMLGRADAALYLSKENGRNRATIAPARVPSADDIELEADGELEAARPRPSLAAVPPRPEPPQAVADSPILDGPSVTDTVIAWDGPRILPGESLAEAG